MFIGRTGAEAETPVLWLPDVKSWLIGKDSDARKDWRQEGKGTTDDEMVGWHHWLDGHEFEQAPGDGERQGSLEQCSPWGHKESSMTERLNWFSYRISRLINMWPRPTVALVIIFYKLYTTFQCNPLPWGYLVKDIYIYIMSCTWGLFCSGKESSCQSRRHRRCGFDPWVGKMPWRRKWQPTPVFLPGKTPSAADPGMLLSMGSQRVRYDWATEHAHMSRGFI